MRLLLKMRCFALAFLLLVSFEVAHAKKITAITFEGSVRSQSSALRRQIRSLIGKEFSSKVVKEDVRRLMSLNFFYDVQAVVSGRRAGLKLTYKLVERPVLGSIKFEGGKSGVHSKISKGGTLKRGQFFRQVDVEKVKSALLEAYRQEGYFLVKVKTKIKELKKRNVVHITFDINAGDKVYVQKISFTGPNKFSSRTLKSLMLTQEKGFFSFISGSGQFRQNYLDRDLEFLKVFYLDKGYLDAQIKSSNLSFSHDKKLVYINIFVSEGEKYKLGHIGLSGDLVTTDKEALKGSRLLEDDYFSASSLRADLEMIRSLYGDKGYAFVNVNPIPRQYSDLKTVDIVFDVKKGSQVNFGKVLIKGNKKTRDRVIRRELEVFEGKSYSNSALKDSQKKVQRLGHFSKVEFKEQVGSRGDVVDIIVDVEERQSSKININAGYNSYSGFVFSSDLVQENFLGKGQYLGFSLSYNSKQSLYNVSFYDPRWNDGDYSFGYDVYKKSTIYPEYDDARAGGSLKVGSLVTDELSLSFNYDIFDAKPTFRAGDSEGEGEDSSDQNHAADVATAQGVDSGVGFTLSYDVRNDRQRPSEGYYIRQNLFYSGIGGDQNYAKTETQIQLFRSLSKRSHWVWRNRLSYSQLIKVGGKPLPFNQRFLLGGAYTLRGYDWYTIGQREGRLGGGSSEFFLQTELEMPLIQEANLLSVVFFDIGGAKDSSPFNELYSDVGFGLRWWTLLGQLRLEWSRPLDQGLNNEHKAVKFNFSIGRVF